MSDSGVEELGQRNVEDLGSALLMFLGFNADLCLSFPASCWELSLSFSADSTLGVFPGTEESQASEFYEQDPDECT